MQRRIINGKAYWEPTGAYDITLRQLIEFQKIAPVLDEKMSAIKEDVKDRIRVIQFFREFIKAASIVSGIDTEVFGSIRNPFDYEFNLQREFARVFDHYYNLFHKLAYKQDMENGKQFKYFLFKTGSKLRKEKYFLFNLTQCTVKQQFYFEEYLKKWIEEKVEGVQMDLSYLPGMIAAIAWKKNELEFYAENADKIKDKTYENFHRIFSERSQKFLDLPVSTAYNCMDYFFFNCRNWKLNIPTSGNHPSQKSKQKLSDTISPTIHWKVP